MYNIGIVTDSTADLPLSFYEKNNVTMVPLYVRFGNEVYTDWEQMTPDMFYSKLRTVNELPKTSQPSVQQFIDAYNKYLGYDHVISVHISAKLSGTYQSASIAAQNVNVPVTVIDSKLTTGGLALIIKELVRGRDLGKSFNDLIDSANHIIENSKVAFYVDTLEYLEKGGRIGKATAIAGSILNIKPILTLDDGVVAPLRKARGKKKAIQEIVEFVKENSQGKTINVALLHADCQNLLEDLELCMKEAGISYETVIKSRIGSIIGTYVGPETIAILFYPAE